MTSLLEKLNQIRYQRLIWLLAVTETFHNLEEAIWLPNISDISAKWHLEVGAVEFRFAVVLITLLIYGIIFYFVTRQSKRADFLLGGTLITILVNVFIPHLIGSIITLHYLPGLMTGLLLNIPATLYLLWRGIKERYFDLKSLMISGFVFLPLGVLVIQLSLFLGRVFAAFLQTQ